MQYRYRALRLEFHYLVNVCCPFWFQPYLPCQFLASFVCSSALCFTRLVLLDVIDIYRLDVFHFKTMPINTVYFYTVHTSALPLNN